MARRMWNSILGVGFVAVAWVNIYLGMFPLINPDLLHLPLMYRDWSSGQLHWFFVNLPPARYIFPDIPVYFFFRTFIPDGLWAQLINTYFNFSLCLALVVANGKIWWKVPAKRSFLPTAIVFAVLSVPGAFPEGVHMGLWWPTMHGGAILISLVNFALVGAYTQRPTQGKLLWLVVAGWVLGFCDPLALVLCLVPVLVLLVFEQRLTKGRRLWLGIIYVLAVLIGSWVGDRLTPSAYLQFIHQRIPALSTIVLHAEFFGRDLGERKVWAWLMLWLGGLGAAVLMWKRGRLRVPEFFGLFAIMSVPLWAMLLNARYMDIESVRYLSFSIMVGFLILWAGAMREYKKDWLMWGLFFILAAGAALGLGQANYKEWSYPTFVKKMDELKSSLQLKDGLADYGTARSLRYFSCKGLACNVLEEDASTFLKLGSLGWLGLRFTPAPARQYNYVLIKNDNISRDMLLLRFGPPETVESFSAGGDSYFVWKYGYNLAEALELDPALWGLLWNRLQSCGHLLGPAERKQTVEGLMQAINNGNEILNELEQELRQRKPPEPRK